MHVLIATGGSAHSQIAVHLAAEMARTAAMRITVLTVVKELVEREKARWILDQAVAILAPAQASVQSKVRVGLPVEEIAREAREGSYDLIFLGERSTHDFLVRLLGSTAHRVMQRVFCPLVVAKGKVRPIRRVLLCDSGAQSPSLLHRFVVRLSELLEGEVDVIVLHVMSQISAAPGIPGKQLRARTDELIQVHAPEGDLLAQDVQVLARTGIQAQPKVRHGLVVDEILAEARHGDYDLIVIGANQSEGWQRFLLDDLAHQIVLKADRPVLVIKSRHGLPGRSPLRYNW